MVTREHLKWYKLGNYALIPFPPDDTPLSELPPLRILPFKMEPKEGLPLLEEDGLEGLEELEDPGLRQPPLFHPLPPLFHPLPEKMNKKVRKEKHKSKIANQENSKKIMINQDKPR